MNRRGFFGMLAAAAASRAVKTEARQAPADMLSELSERRYQQICSTLSPYGCSTLAALPEGRHVFMFSTSAEPVRVGAFEVRINNGWSSNAIQK